MKVRTDMVDLVGSAAAMLVIAAFYVTDYGCCRRLAIGSNVLFLIYAWGLQLWPVLALHGILLPLNAARLAHLRVPDSRHWLRDHMSDEEREEFLRNITLGKDLPYLAYASCGGRGLSRRPRQEGRAAG